jgi:hypothetical protein
MSRRLQTIIALGLGLVALLFLLWPHERPVAPRWEITVRNSANAPVAGVKVFEFAQDYSAEFEGQHLVKYTDGAGLVVFERRVLRVPYLSLAFRMMMGVINSGVHVSFGPTCYGGVVLGPQSSIPIFPNFLDKDGVAHSEVRI